MNVRIDFINGDSWFLVNVKSISIAPNGRFGYYQINTEDHVRRFAFSVVESVYIETGETL